MGRKKKADEDNSESSGLVKESDYIDNLTESVNAFCDTWRVALSPAEQNVEDFDIMRVRNALGLYRNPEGLDIFPRARKMLAERGYVFRAAFDSEVMFLVRRGHEIQMDVAVYEEMEGRDEE